MGPNGATLTAMGKTKFLMWATFIAACINVGLNVVLIPLYGATGAALATIIAILSVNIIRSIKLYSISKIHSLEKNILKPIFLSSTLIFIIYFLTEKFLTITFWMLPLIFIFFILIYGVSLLLTKSFDQEDIDVLLNIEKKTGLNFIKVKRLIKRFF
jgi:O-antigen/teichoic acid export membrane protein